MKPKEYLRSIPAIWGQKKFLKTPCFSEATADNLIISLTSFPKRFRGLPYVIASLFNQSIRPSKVILWVDRDAKKQLPSSVLTLTEHGLEIYETEDNHKSYLKLLPTLNLYPNADIVTADDDLIYHETWLEKLLEGSKRDTRGIHAYVTRTIEILGEGQLRHYSQWRRDRKSAIEGSPLTMPLGFAGVYYPANTFTNEVFNAQVFKKLAPHADDLWFKVMTLLADKKSYQINTPFGTEVYLPGTQHLGLKKTNVHQNENQAQMEKLLNHYQLWSSLNDT